MAERILRHPEVTDRTKLGKTRIWQLEKQGKFPRRRQLGGRTVGWLESEIDEFLRSLPAGIDRSRCTGAAARDDLTPAA